MNSFNKKTYGEPRYTGAKRGYGQAFGKEDGGQDESIGMFKSLMGKMIQNMVLRSIKTRDFIDIPRSELDKVHDGIITKYEMLRTKIIEGRASSRQYVDKPWYLELQFKQTGDRTYFLICKEQDDSDWLEITEETPIKNAKELDSYVTALDSIFVRKEKMSRESELAKELGLDSIFSFKPKKPEAQPQPLPVPSQEEEKKPE